MSDVIQHGITNDVVREIARERYRQVAQEGWDAEHDDRHPPGELAQAAAVYALIDSQEVMSDPFANGIDTLDDHPVSVQDIARAMWPWEKEWLKPKTMRRNLIVAAALIVAEIERMDRAEELGA